MHLREPADLWERYIDPEFRGCAPKGFQRTPLDVGVEVDGKTGPGFQAGAQQWIQNRHDDVMTQYAHDIERDFDAVAQLQAMDREGIDITVLFPSRGLYANSYEGMDPEFSLAIAQAYNNWLSDFCREGDPDRMYGAAMVAVQDVEASAGEARRAVDELGFKAVFLRPNPPARGVYFHHRSFDPLWAEIQRLGVGGGLPRRSGLLHAHEPERTGFGYDEFALQHACSHPHGADDGPISHDPGRRLERFPELRVAFLEANASWLTLLAVAAGRATGSWSGGMSTPK